MQRTLLISRRRESLVGRFSLTHSKDKGLFICQVFGKDCNYHYPFHSSKDIHKLHFRPLGKKKKNVQMLTKKRWFVQITVLSHTAEYKCHFIYTQEQIGQIVKYSTEKDRYSKIKKCYSHFPIYENGGNDDFLFFRIILMINSLITTVGSLNTTVRP